MKKTILLALLALSLSACNVMQTNSGTGVVFVDVKEPVASNPGIALTKTGEACQESFFGLVSVGDSSVEKARHNGNIKKIATIDVTKKNVLVYGVACTVVKGE